MAKAVTSRARLKPAERARVLELFERPAHPYTRALIKSVPIPDPGQPGLRDQTVIEGEIPSSIDPPSGCRFRTRCPFAAAVCAEREPPLNKIAEDHWVACHFVERSTDGRIRAP